MAAVSYSSHFHGGSAERLALQCAVLCVCRCHIDRLMLPCRACGGVTCRQVRKNVFGGLAQIGQWTRQNVHAGISSVRTVPLLSAVQHGTARHACSAAVQLSIGPLCTVGSHSGSSIDSIPTLSGRCRSTALPPMLELRESSAMCASTCVPCMRACVCLRVHVCVRAFATVSMQSAGQCSRVH